MIWCVLVLVFARLVFLVKCSYVACSQKQRAQFSQQCSGTSREAGGDSEHRQHCGCSGCGTHDVLARTSGHLDSPALVNIYSDVAWPILCHKATQKSGSVGSCHDSHHSHMSALKLSQSPARLKRAFWEIKGKCRNQTSQLNNPFSNKVLLHTNSSLVLHCILNQDDL